MTENTFADLTRVYVHAYGGKAAMEVVAAILEEDAKTAPGKPASVMASINADLLRQAMARMV